MVTTDSPDPRRDETHEAEERRQRITEVGVGITLVGVIVNMGLTIGLGLSGTPLFVRLPLAAGMPLLLVLTLAFLTRRINLLSTIPWWLTEHGPDPWGNLGGGDDDEPRRRA